jgi:hypothetical protein
MNDNNTKPGIATTEFWLALIVTIMGAVAGIYAEAQWAQVAGLVAATLAAAGYGFSRSNVKRTEAAAQAGAAERAFMTKLQAEQRANR